MKRYSVIAILLALGLTSCNSVRIIPLDAYKAHEAYDHAVLYNLPKNQFHFEIKVNEMQLIPGDFSAYSQELLGIQPVTEKQESSWRIADISIEMQAIPDSSHYYMIDQPGRTFLAYPRFSPSGLLLSFNTDVPQAEENFIRKGNIEGELSMDLQQSGALINATEERVDTTYKYFDTDTASYRVPLIRKSVVSKSSRDQAQDVAKMLLELREEKFNLLMGEENEFPDGRAFEVAFNEYERIENQYLPLFMGKTRQQNFFYQFSFLPDTQSVKDGVVLGYFNDKTGFSGVGTNPADAVILRFELINSPALFDSLAVAIDSAGYKTPGLYVRNPATYRLIISHKNKVLAQAVYPISQLGKVYQFPVKDVLCDKTYIEFYPETGAIKKVSSSGSTYKKRALTF